MSTSLASIAAKDYMMASLVTFSPEQGVLTAIQTMVEKEISGAPVVDDHGNLIGVLSEKDCMKVALNVAYHGEWGGRVAEYMSYQVATVDADTSIPEVAAMFMEGDYRRYPVVKDNRLVGQISRRDVLRALATLRGK